MRLDTFSFWRNGFWSLLSLCSAFYIVLVVGYFYLESALPDVSQLREFPLQVPMQIYTQDGKLIGEFGEKRRIPIQLHQAPPLLIQALVATEDQRFFNHAGVDFLSLGRAALELIKTGEKLQGGSTITMQVARNFFLDSEKTYLRKLNEILLAIKIDRTLSKEAILELYLNRVYLGHHAYGFAAASQIYYGKPLHELSLAQLAMLAGIPKAPSRLNPLADKQRALQRRHHVLQRMLEEGVIDQARFERSLQEPLNAQLHQAQIDVKAPHAAEMVRLALVEQFGQKAYTEGFKVWTTLDSRLQTLAYQTLKQGLIDYTHRHPSQKKTSKPEPDVEGALASLDPKQGAIKALIGGFDFQRSHYNRAIQTNRQPGSVFKPFIYASALIQGYTLATVINDAPIAIADPSSEGGVWRPQNDNKRFYGPTRLRSALTHSRNLVSVRLLQEMGVDTVKKNLIAWGLPEKQIQATLSLSLGTLHLSPLQLTALYAMFANGGYRVNPFLIQSIHDRDGKTIFQAQPQPKPVLNPQIAYLMTLALRDVITMGTAQAANSLNRDDLAGKTGTTQDFHDAWFAGYNTHLATTIWVGYDQPRSLKEWGRLVALPIFVDYTRSALKDQPDGFMKEPPGLVTVNIDPHTGLLAHPDQAQTVLETFTEETVPDQHAALGTSPGDQTQDEQETSTSANEDLF